ncbi:MAG: mannose-6-phosphate isomerase [Candidatus Lokiarchaeota archaeon]|nr:mannose-6-phosphate isomerase [Candidatus Lokiarchaeota archaeon]
MNRWIHDLPPNRTRRAYAGGLLLDKLQGATDPSDGDRPEDWVASVVPARNPGLVPIENEGLSTLNSGDGGVVLLKDVIEGDPTHYLGEAHVNAHGTSPGFLVKMLDSATRLNLQAHPTREFARSRLNSPFGKLECYHIIETRPAYMPAIHLGFQHPPGRAEFRRAVVEQDIPAMASWFESIPVQPGETWLVPGGVPHALGGGLLLVEVMEPSDLAIRFEFERGGVVVPPEARFLGRDVDFAMDVIDFTRLPVDEAFAKCRLMPRELRSTGDFSEQVLVEGHQVDCFEVHRFVVERAASIPKDTRMLVCIVVQGAGEMAVNGEAVGVEKGSKVLVPAAARAVKVVPRGEDPVVLVGCMTGRTLS